MKEKKNASILIIILVLIIVAGFFMWMGGDKAEVTNNTPEMEDKALSAGDSSDKMMDEGDSSDMALGDVKGEMMKTGSYEAYDASKLATADSKTILFFKATWCPSCRALDKALDEEVGDIPEGVTILEVDYDSHEELRKRYGVTTQHTLVQVDANGDLVHKWSGSPSLASVLKQVK